MYIVALKASRNRAIHAEKPLDTLIFLHSFRLNFNISRLVKQ